MKDALHPEGNVDRNADRGSTDRGGVAASLSWGENAAPTGAKKLHVNAKLALTVVAATVCVSAPFRYTWPGLAMLLFVLPLLWLLWLRRWSGAAVYLLLTAGTQALMQMHDLYIGSFGISLLLVMTILRNFLPGLTVARLTLAGSTISEFINGMRRLHIPMAIVLALAVLFRFVPTVHEERVASRAALSVRGLGTGFTLRHPARAFSYRLIPWLSCCARIGDELTKASLCRGLSLARPRTVWPDEGYHAPDYLCFALCALCLAAWLFVLLAPSALCETVARWGVPGLSDLLRSGAF